MNNVTPEFLKIMNERHEKINKELRIAAKRGAAIFPPDVPKISFVPLDLSVNNKELKSIDRKNPRTFYDYIFNQIRSQWGRVGYGGYFEERHWSQPPHMFDDVIEPQNIHIGLDLWIEANTPIVAPLTGKIHSIKNKTQATDFAPTIVLEHEIEGIPLYSLYGNLSGSSLKGKEIGQTIKQGDQFAWIGSSTTENKLLPNLHFQLMLDMMGFEGDFPGACSKSKRSLFEAIVPNPELLLNASL